MRFRRVVSLFLLVELAFFLATCIVLYVVPHGRVAYWSGWSLWGLTKTAWTDLHINLGLLLLIAVGFHVYYNWRAITGYLRNRAQRVVVLTGEFIFVLLIVAAAMLGTHFGIPPLRWVIDLNTAVKDAGSARYGEPPYGHAELSTLETLVRRLDLDLADVEARLTSAGYHIANTGETLEALAAANSVTPQALYEVMVVEAATESSATGAGLPKIPPPQTGKRQLGELCAEYGLDTQAVVELLAAEGIRADPTHSLREIAAENDLQSDAVYELIRLATAP
ncbi:MAG: DUF4405 domain-containing protein [Candidatus Eisenbacteria sp.]|nr:DUF4405 domain-containing protein [Candidatus Eisenbacteria bacterium]